MNGVQTRFKCKLDVKRCKRFVFPPSSLLPRSNALKTKAIRYFQTDRTLTRIVSPPLQGEVTTDIPFVEYPDFESLTEDRIEMIIGLKSSKPLQGDEKIQSVILPARRIVVCLHRGNYNELAQLYNEMTEWIKTNGYKASGTSIEYYYSNPDVPEEEHVTRVEMPLL